MEWLQTCLEEDVHGEVGHKLPKDRFMTGNIQFQFSFRLPSYEYLHPNQVNGVGITTVSICASHFLRDQRYGTIDCSAVPWPGVCYSLIISFIRSR